MENCVHSFKARLFIKSMFLSKIFINSIQSDAGKQMWDMRKYVSQASIEPLGRAPPSMGPWLCAGKNSRASHS